MSSQIIVVGGGLSGLSAAHTVLERGGRVLVIEKNPFMGGNSTKATSGINGTLTKTQIAKGIPDSPEKFFEDTAKSAKDLARPPLIQVLTGNSASAVEWLQTRFGLDLSLVSQLGGHSFPRTHRGKEKFPGMTITYALMEKFDDISRKEPHRARILYKARATRLLQEGGNVVGIEFEQDGKLHQEYGPVILATGGYAADFAADGLIKKYRPDLMHLPTTNGDWSTGDGLKMVAALGGNQIDMDKVQVHPTGLVDPNEPDAKVKFLAAEALRGVGGVLLNKEGHRFCDELGTRDYVTGEMWKNNKGPYRLVLNSSASKEIEWHCKHYMGRGLMKFFKSGAELAAEMGISLSTLEDTFNKYNSYATNKNDPFGKKYFHNMPFKANDTFYVAIVTPVVHYCMGGVEITPEAEIIGPKGPIPGLFGAGELAGGVHGANRLGGSSLLGCVVFGRVAGDTAARYFMSKMVNAPATQLRRLDSLATQLGADGISAKLEVSPQNNKVHLELSWNGVPVTAQPAPAAPSVAPATGAPAAPAQPAAADRNKEWTHEEVAKHNKENDCWVIVNGQVLNVTKFLADHPGGKKAILIFAGKDASDEFNMLHKPDVIDKYAAYTVIGKIKSGSKPAASSHAAPAASSSGKTYEPLTPSTVESRNSGGTAGVLPAERAKATFEIEKMTNILDGSAELTKKRRFIISPLKGIDNITKYYMDRPQLMKEHVRHFMEVHNGYWDNYKPSRMEVAWMVENASLSGSLMNHYGLFLPTLDMQAGDEQRKWWSMKARKCEIVGCYAQTELGHGSNVRGLMTTAVFDKNTQEFILDTPTLRAMKWWPGTLGKIATHAIVYAQLIIDGKEYGVHAFMLQIRDENHKPLPGIELGDLGPKLGDHANDTGYMRLNNVRVPREFLLNRYQDVTPQGEYVVSESKKKNARLHYATMMFTRGSMVKSSGGFLAKAATIATRYGCVRVQGFVDHKKGKSYKAPEKQIIDYGMQRYRIFKQIAMAYCIKFTGTWMLNRFKDIEGENRSLKGLDDLPEIAATSSGLKALCTFFAWQGIEDCRKCCGGNGYLLVSGVAQMAADYAWQTTAEGDFIILTLQTAQFLLKSVQNAVTGKRLGDVVAYLAPLKDAANFNLAKLAPAQAKSHEDFYNLDYLIQLYRYSALSAVVNVSQEFQQRLGEMDGKFDDALNSCAIELCNAVRSHTFVFMLSNFAAGIAAIEDKGCKQVLQQLAAFWACSNIIDDGQWIGILSSSQLRLVKTAVTKLLDTLRPNAVALTDAFDFPDNVLNSAIGKYDGNVYEALYDFARKSPLNQVEVFEGYQEVLRPYLDVEFLKTGNRKPKL